ncbi:MAG: type II toxin-antitoxin system RelE/ParE family toxin [Puniceicoccaceae bacterium]|nr:MAG: type II toxin-antitoxin system RelE/ParE family toxin [Puniceicoccaceae bacterium]
MILSFACPETEKLFNGQKNKLLKDLQRAGLRKLLFLSQANELNELKIPPGNRLHPLLKDRKEQHAIWVNTKYRLYFRFENGNAYDAEITDYH